MPPKRNENSKTENQEFAIKNRSVSKGELDLKLKSRRPLSPVPNSTPSMKVTRGIKITSRPIIQCDDRISEPSENDVMDFESIEERTLLMLVDNCDDTISSQLTTRSRS